MKLSIQQCRCITGKNSINVSSCDDGQLLIAFYLSNKLCNKLSTEKHYSSILSATNIAEKALRLSA